ncbi:sodium:proton antiporter NhaD [Shewanella sp. NFH-SH190041]|uniref:sodium:proton antiporter NhaD n=1 Tax=Shewanella sp. NFH-SH190041 TaxID=2950245 RepID=UPI0021C375D7|nr:sodium:proton antiporter NhaD [Shewanella sp. NFH-SH190041]BDM63514.1 sodium:proton antiporter NhaD [Shewanella sp. NFH-SH190041]
MNLAVFSSARPRAGRMLAFLAALISLCCLPGTALAAEHTPVNMTAMPAGIIALALFVLAYVMVIGEEKLHIQKSKPVLLAAGLIWGLIGLTYSGINQSEMAEAAFRHNLLEYAELFLFLMVAMTYINAMEERGLFDALRGWIINRGLTLRQVFWLTGFMAFFISPVADNLTTALLMCAVVMKVGKGYPKFIAMACINIVVAANAGGAFSPFGDITTLMVWQKGVVQFGQFFDLFVPSLLNFAVPAFIMSLFIGSHKPQAENEQIFMKRGARRIVVLFLLTICCAVLAHSVLGMPPVLGMMFGLGLLQFFGFYLRRSFDKARDQQLATAQAQGNNTLVAELQSRQPFNIFSRIALVEWDTMLFFYGVMLCVGGLGFMGYLAVVSHVMYEHWNITCANVVVGVLSSVIDNIPVMFAILTMDPVMSHGQWLLVTMTAGVGGSLLSIGSAAGVALMGQARGVYTFASHLKWTPAIALGYIVSILAHMWMNASLF